jgi:H+/gluconate symporter-like permease
MKVKLHAFASLVLVSVITAIVVGFPIFFDAGLVVFLPIILTVARRVGGSLLLYALPAPPGRSPPCTP